MTMHQIPDPIRAGIARGWKIFGGTPHQSPEGTHKPLPARITADVAIIGTGAGAGITAEILTKAGLKVVLIEEGPLKSSHDFRQRESDAYPSLYQESAARKTADKAINILQGRCVGGSTTVNWTTSLRTPDATLRFWAEQLGLKDYTSSALEPYFRQAQMRLNISPWLTPPNENNDLLRRGALKLGIPVAAMARNVKGCASLGSCGMGCPTNAKQSMLVTSLPAALDAGATLLVETHAERFEFAKDRVSALQVRSVMPNGSSVRMRHGQNATKIVAKHYVLAAGAINSPAVLLRSQAPDPHSVLGQRTFLHPVVLSAAVMPDPVQGWAGAPQTIYSDHFLDTQPIDGPIGYKLEVPPMHPVIFASTALGYGTAQAQLLSQFASTHTLLALLRDGFHPQSTGGSVGLRSDGSPVLDYPLTAFVMDGARRALLSMAEIQFAAGARQVIPMHELVTQPLTTWSQAKAIIGALPMQPLLTKLVSAHVMGGCAMAASEKHGIVRPDGVHWQLENLSVHDGSIFPTSTGANPQLSIYGIVNRLAQGLALRLGRRSVSLV